MSKWLVAAVVAVWGVSAALAEDQPLAVGRHEETGARVEAGAAGGWRVQFTPGAADAVVRLKPAEGTWNLDAATAVLVDVRNRGDQPAALCGRFNNSKWSGGLVIVAPGATETARLWLYRDNPPRGFAYRYPQMCGRPGDVMWLWSMPDPAKIAELDFLPAGDLGARDLELSNIRSRPWNQPLGKVPGPLDDDIFPFVDAYGQYMHRDWPGKIHSDADLLAARTAEEAELKANPGPADWDAYGGWAKGPTLKATGHFRTEQVDGRWWLVDPDGHLFWSTGLDCVGTTYGTTTKMREHFYASLPPDAARAGWWVTMDGITKTKYQGDATRYAEQAHLRLRSWGLNTVGNWSERSVYAHWRRRTPYVLGVWYGGPKLGNGFPDVKQPGFRTALAEALATYTRQGADKDPYCLGVFVDNELHGWTEDEQTAEAYFATVREEVRRALPNKLYLGCRFDFHYFPAEGPRAPVRVASKYCDVVSFNHYRFTADDLRLPAGAEDKPLLIGEFHFGALDRGPLHTGLRGVASQAQRAAAYQLYLRTALRNPALVGAHWFQYADQPVTGRFDAENYQIGFVDVADNPYPETTAASRAIGQGLYELRTGAR